MSIEASAGIESAVRSTSLSGATSPKIKIEPGVATAGSDVVHFRDAMERQGAAAQAQVGRSEALRDKSSLGEALAARASGLAAEINKDQQYVSKLLEQASRTGDSMQLMKAMVALHDYQIRVQAIAKTVSKATNSFDQLTKLQ